jgi:hypothetical protein
MNIAVEGREGFGLARIQQTAELGRQKSAGLPTPPPSRFNRKGFSRVGLSAAMRGS